MTRPTTQRTSSTALSTLGPRLLVVTAAACIGLMATGCEEAEGGEEQAEANLPLANVDLPPVPADLGVSQIPEAHPDGSLTIDGLRRKRHEHLEKDVTVSGFVTFIYDCPYWEDDKKKRRRRRRKAEEDEAPKMCQRHHLYLHDKEGENQPLEDRLLVVNISPHYQKKIEEGELKLGQRYTMTGRYTDAGDGFVETETGLLIMQDVKGLEPVEEEEKK